MKLLSSPTSPYVRKVRVVLIEKKLDYQSENANVWDADTRIQEHNPLGKVPCLVTDDGSALFDSRVIVEYLDTLSPVGSLIPKGGRERAAVKCWEALADGTLDACISIVKEQQRPAGQQSPEWIERQYGKIHAALSAMETGLGEQNFCLGISYTLADIAVGCVTGYMDLRFADIDWRSNHPNLARLDKKLMTRHSFIETAPPAA
jgi:glutathione S-transferase